MSQHVLLSLAARPRTLLGALALALLSACQSAPTSSAPSALLPIATEAATSQGAGDAAPPAPILGNDADTHGCKPSTGHAWCQRTQRCERPWELALQRGFENTPDGWHAYCDGTKR